MADLEYSDGGYQFVTPEPVGSLEPLDLELDEQQPEVGPPSPEEEALATPDITPKDGDDEDRLIRGWRRDAFETFDWFADVPGVTRG